MTNASATQFLAPASHDTAEDSEIAVEGRTLQQQCASLLSKCKDAQSARGVIEAAQKLINDFEAEFEPRYTYCLIRELMRVRIGMLELWTDLHERFPDSAKALRYRLRWLARSHRAEEGHVLIERRYLGVSEPTSLEARLEKADLLNEIREHAAVNALFAQVLVAYPDSVAPRLRYARRLADRGDLVSAVDVLEPLVNLEEPPRAARDLYGKLTAAIEVLQRFHPGAVRGGENLQPLAFQYCIEHFRDRRSEPPPSDRVGATTFITGSLGPGGSERQLAQTAVALQIAREQQRALHDIEMEGPFHIVVRSLSSEDRNDFFLSMVTEAKVVTQQIDHMPTAEKVDLDPADEELAVLLPFLPSGAIYGVRHLVDYFRASRIETAFIWQDGAVLMACLAALIAKVPRIVVSLRGQPSVVRTHRHHEGYLTMYRALAIVPGVEFLSNNNAAAEAYCAWLEVPSERFSVIHNGVTRLPASGSLSEREAWASFEARTRGASKTIGGVFRFDLDKNPLAWIRFVKRCLTADENARFVLVGAGRMHGAAVALAEELGVAHRILFVGVSRAVGYWLSKMDVLVLLSRFEGLPNVLIEAQLAGVGVVATPAGGSEEAFLPGKTGILLSSATNPDLTEICDAVDEVLSWQRRSPFLQKWMQRFAAERFSLDKMVGQMAAALSGNIARIKPVRPDVASVGENRTPATRRVHAWSIGAKS